MRRREKYLAFLLNTLKEHPRVSSRLRISCNEGGCERSDRERDRERGRVKKSGRGRVRRGGTQYEKEKHKARESIR